MEKNYQERNNLLLSIFLIAFLLIMLFVAYYKANSRKVVLGYMKKAENLVYYEATLHNPKGDFFPDWIDDAIKGKIKKIF